MKRASFLNRCAVTLIVIWAFGSTKKIIVWLDGAVFFVFEKYMIDWEKIKKYYWLDGAYNGSDTIKKFNIRD